METSRRKREYIEILTRKTRRMGLLKQYRAKSTTFRDGKSAADFVSKESSFDKINNKNRRADDSKRASSTTSFSNNGGDDKKQQQVKKWKTKRAGAKERRIRILRSLPLSRALTEQELAKMFKTVLQPVRAKYGGAGFAKPSVYVDISDEYFSEKFQELFDEHVEGFGGKSLVKMGKEEMLWQKRLKEKQGREKNDDNSNSGTNTNDNNNYRSKKRRSIKRGEENADAAANAPLSRKQRKLALRRGEVVLDSDKKISDTKAISELQKQALAAAEAAFG